MMIIPPNHTTHNACLQTAYRLPKDCLKTAYRLPTGVFNFISETGIVWYFSKKLYLHVLLLLTHAISIITDYTNVCNELYHCSVNYDVDIMQYW